MNAGTFQSDVFKGSQSWNRVDLVRVTTVRGDIHTLRFTLHRDGYESQSYGRVERFDGIQWHQILRVPCSLVTGLQELSNSSPTVEAKAYLTRGMDDLCR